MNNWKGVRNANQFGPRCMQRTSPSADYWFRSNGMSEDCLYLNVWASAKSAKEKLPGLVFSRVATRGRATRPSHISLPVSNS